MRELTTREQTSWRRSRTARARLVLVDNVPPNDAPPGSQALDDRSFAELAGSYRAKLHQVALRLSGNRTTAEDLVQQTLERALRRFDRFQPGTHPGTWLAKILTNLFLDQIKHEKVMRKAEPELAAHAEADDDPIDGIADADLYAAIEALDPELRQVVELCYLRQLRYREVAAMLNLPLGTIGTRLMRARVRLRELLTPTSLDAVKP